MRSGTNCLRRNKRDHNFIERSLGFKDKKENVVIRKGEKEKKGREGRYYDILRSKHKEIIWVQECIRSA